MISDENAVVGLPMYLMVAIIVAAVILAIFSLSIYNVWLDAQFHQVESEIETIISEAENMFAYADNGTLITVHVEFLSSMKYLVFGDLPQNGIAEPTNLTFKENTSNSYYFVMNDGRISTAHSPVRFSSDDINEIAVFYPGVYDVTLELDKVDGRTYVKIY